MRSCIYSPMNQELTPSEVWALEILIKPLAWLKRGYNRARDWFSGQPIYIQLALAMAVTLLLVGALAWLSIEK